LESLTISGHELREIDSEIFQLKGRNDGQQDEKRKVTEFLEKGRREREEARGREERKRETQRTGKQRG
jgi:hypothetical protein